jgi:uncharacterized coiled-coil protein SlyX|tara:strand:+ start:551 stop:871 length:321 start_codon:yes stop_codon:yes gene_type:complete
MVPEILFAAVASIVTGWGAFTYKKAETARTVADRALHRIDKIELKMAEQYITKQDFETSMDRLFDTLDKMNQDMKYITERVDYHVNQQAQESKELRRQLQTKRRFF